MTLTEGKSSPRKESPTLREGEPVRRREKSNLADPDNDSGRGSFPPPADGIGVRTFERGAITGSASRPPTSRFSRHPFRGWR